MLWCCLEAAAPKNRRTLRQVSRGAFVMLTDENAIARGRWEKFRPRRS